MSDKVDLRVDNLVASGDVTLSDLTVSTALALDASKGVVSVTNTGTGNNVLATAPALAGASYLASNPTAITGRKTEFNTGSVTMQNSTISLLTIPTTPGLSGMVFIACESSGGIGFGYIIHFVMSNNSFSATALSSGSSQGTHGVTLSLSGSTIQLTTTYLGGIGGTVTGTAAGFVVAHTF